MVPSSPDSQTPLSPADRVALLELPKLELHCHLEGSMSVGTVRALTERNGADPRQVWPNGFPEAFSFDGFPDFAAQYFYGLSLFKGAADLATATDDLAAVLARQNVRYAELTTTAYTHFLDRSIGDGTPRSALTVEDYCEGLNEGRRLAAARGVEIGWVIDIPRDIETPDQEITVDFVTGSRVPDGLVALGLGGYEVGFPAAPYADQFQRAIAHGLGSVPHAGETEGADSVRSAIEDLGATRIGHGVRCLEDPTLVDLIVGRGIFLEVCPTSNLLLHVVEDLADHPFPSLREAGIRTCLNTDDPGWFATDLMTELVIGSERFGLTLGEHRAMQLDALAASFAPDDVRARLSAELAT